MYVRSNYCEALVSRWEKDIMATFFYRAKNYEGKSIQGELEGDTKEQVQARLREKGFFVTHIEKRYPKQQQKSLVIYVLIKNS